VRLQHTTRYEWACSFINGCKVIDAASGTGYGAKLLAENGASEVDCFDLSPDVIHEARKVHSLNNVRFEVADVIHLPSTDHCYDVYVSFETIEHVDGEAFLREVVRVLRPGGTFICSTPNRILTNPGISITELPFNPYHMREYTINELETLLLSFFGSVNFYGQSTYSQIYSSMLCLAGSRIPLLAVRLHQIRKLLGMPFDSRERHVPQARSHWKGEPEVLIAVCST